MLFEKVREFSLLTPSEQAIVLSIATESLAAAVERDREIVSRPPRVEKADGFMPPLLHLMPPWEKISEEQREWVRLVDALQSLPSRLYWAKKERLGIEEYLRQYQTTRVR
jgi:hypothetical protein